jgi:hypothetical protein
MMATQWYNLMKPPSILQEFTQKQNWLEAPEEMDRATIFKEDLSTSIRRWQVNY